MWPLKTLRIPELVLKGQRACLGPKWQSTARARKIILVKNIKVQLCVIGNADAENASIDTMLNRVATAQGKQGTGSYFFQT